MTNNSVTKRSGRKLPLRDVKILYGWSAAMCAFPDCRRPCIADATGKDPEVVTGKIAHISAHSADGPRFDPTLTPNERDSYQNWILLCGEHHDIVDNQPNTYTSADLSQWKEEHEQWVRTMYRESLPSVSFAELKIVAQALLNIPETPTDSYVLTPPLEKIKKNGLTQHATYMLTLAIGKAEDVSNFLEGMARMDYEFPERLKAGFVSRYNKFIGQGLHGDIIFEGMLDFVTGISSDFKVKSAGLAVLGYMFEKCEVFEP